MEKRPSHPRAWRTTKVRRGSDPHDRRRRRRSETMAQTKSAKTAARSSAKSVTATNKKGTVLTDEERAAMKELVKERKAVASREEEASAVLAKIAEMAASDRAMAKRVHAIVTASAPALSPKLWYGMPAYYKDGKGVCFFQDATKFESRYATFGFSDSANLDEAGLWPVAFALKELTAAAEARIGALVKKAVS